MAKAVSKPEAYQGDGKGPLYADRIKVHPREFVGPFRKWKTILLWVFLGLYHFFAWVRWDRGPGVPDQAVLFDLPGRRAYIFWIEIWPQEVYYLTGLLIIAAISLFAASAIAGRVWCGFACFQTVWTDLFMKVEGWIEGDRAKRIKLDKSPMSMNKFLKRVAKHTIWLMISLFMAVSFLWYFNDAPTITKDLLTGNVGGWTLITLGVLTSMTYIMAGFAREQVCFYMCPYGRFQGVMTDEDSLLVTYEAWRGEPRMKGAKNLDSPDRGHCVDCGLCVQACPTGIDIRDGQQMECIGCGLCIDACNTMMDNLKLPRNLISYDSYTNMIAREKGEGKQVHLIRPRTIIYAILLTAVTAVLMISLSIRDRLEVNIIRDRAPLFVTLSDGDIRNGYTYKILNMESVGKTYELSIAGIDGVTMDVIGQEEKAQKTVTLKAKADRVASFKLFLKAPRGELDGASTDIDFILKDVETGEISSQATVFRGPK
ncbi:cytochrome c oxidase accessory protein CcoG [Terasakiella sp. A23]|uniref:cytochrome c oxidase accessory protein CcoG n=1 Tax=Terasakiella sp. FCG-A23 TaxID=3080561 RepID=UPI0029532F5F|nr:cytochrome c oxidase accessory protein CcoG [Terasakiella sp. A23]MDV7341148.1 cytochrome c oxidase accessory protein CcoG [Terasakiella sp. A23]